MYVKEITIEELGDFLPYLKENLPQSLNIYTSVQGELSHEYEEKQKFCILKSSVASTDDPIPAFVFHRMECDDDIVTVFCPEEKNHMVRSNELCFSRWFKNDVFVSSFTT